MSDETLSEKLLKELSDGLLIYYAVKNHQLIYSVMNRPEPTLSGIDDHALATSIIYAVRSFKFIHDPNRGERERVARTDGRDVTYTDSIDIDFDRKTITSTRRLNHSKDMLAGVVTDLMRKAKAPSQMISGTPKPGAVN
jgi:hypothetical protein